MSGLVNKVKDALHSDKSSTTHSQPEGTAGPHSSRAANTADPRVDSDRDHRANPTTTTGLHGSHGTHGTTTGTSGLGGSSYATSGTHEPSHAAYGTHEGAYGGVGDNRGLDGPASRTDGPHSSNLANKADPRVDSDRDYSKNLGANPQRSANVGSNTHSTGHTGTTGHSTLGSSTGTHGHTTGTTGHSTLGSSTGTHGHTTGTTGHSTLGSNTGAPEGTYGQHNSRVANAADPRIDSDRDHRSAPGHAFGTTNTTGRTGGLGDSHTTGHTGHSAGTHTTGTHTTAGGIGGSIAPGPAANTAGPHKSDLLNKADPRVDSNLDGSKTYGGNKTTTTTSSAYRDPTDAAQVPPSVLQKHVGAPVVAHDDHAHDRERRHSVSTHQEREHGL